MSRDMAARLTRLTDLVGSDLDAIPNQRFQVDVPDPSDDEKEGGIALGCENATEEFTDSIDDQPTVSAATGSIDNQSGDSSAFASTENTDRRFVWMPGEASSYNLGTAPATPSSPYKALPPTDLQRGELAPPGKYFTPLLALAKYPYRYCDRDSLQNVASQFFDGGKFWAREWDIYYTWDIDGTKPLTLVTEDQFKDLVAEVNTAFGLGLKTISHIVTRFPDHPRCRPRYLGRVKGLTREEIDTMARNAPPASSATPGQSAAPSLDGRTLDDFKKTMEDMWDAQKNKNKAAREKKNEQRAAKQHDLVQRFKRAQRYLGLRPSDSTDLAPVDVSTPTTLPFDQSVVFVCIDVESWERAHDKITEVGIATLDTLDLVGVAPGKDGENWRTLIRARHIRIDENKHLINSNFVAGCPDRFDFGKSEFVRLHDVATQVAACFRHPFSGPAAHNPEDASKERNIIFLGHDTFSDVKYLQQLGFDPLKVPNMLETLDTATLYRVWRREQNPTNLGRILYDFDIAGFNLHNAGNDAVFTVQAMLAVCVREASIRGTELQAKREEDKAARLDALTEEARLRFKEEHDGWSETEDNGGPPAPIVLVERPKVDGNAGYDQTNRTDGRGRGRGRGRGEARGGNQSPSFRGARGGNAFPSRGFPTFDNLHRASRGSTDQRARRDHPASRGYHSPRGNETDRASPRARGGGRGRGRGRGSSDNQGWEDGVSSENQGWHNNISSENQGWPNNSSSENNGWERFGWGEPA
ncbi:hypothetical protein BU24DRAFT_423048 [Aaosphaeria arxii CBS 175.79]|uniref:Gfd2/YDR514C-like C-terminal domain-containing protein n=1 Tax=Aaosphaeria arxii CBS 175.79 TaxID=1450172 RepID=A0A6A5XWP4_9PLEO|nr:uncharacterized protein BU24DRAFT_423048 [Aaosphaeria arxii CBS 175.79]KAF2016674.1 hypothetical protein BU24DRAFT_423048 [Aaosphaeria arxii CBS 175.79]